MGENMCVKIFLNYFVFAVKQHKCINAYINLELPFASYNNKSCTAHPKGFYTNQILYAIARIFHVSRKVIVKH